MTRDWPSFELASFRSWNGVPAAARDAMTASGVPKRSLGRLYWALDSPTEVQVDGYGALVRFGNSGLSVGLYFDPSSEAVLEIVDAPGAAPTLVNTTLAQFTETVKTVIGMYPFYSRNTPLDARIRIAADISAAIGQIDPAALDPDRFWATFIDDVTSGDYATEEVSGPPDVRPRR
jgi:hypothetical protein